MSEISRKGFNSRLIKIIFSFSTLIFLLLLSYHLSLNFITKTPYQQQTIDFLSRSSENVLTLNYTSLELSHLQDVKIVMHWTNYLFYLSLFIVIFIITYSWKNKPQLKQLLSSAGITSFTALGVILIFSLLFFNQVFTLFHQLFFPQGNWIFPLDSRLIQTFPLEFFISISQLIFLLSITFSLILIFVPRIISKYLSRKTL